MRSIATNIMITISGNFEQFAKSLVKSYEAVGFAKTVALTRTAKATASFLGEETVMVFDRPTPFTQRAFAWEWATPDKTGLFVFVKDFAFKGVAAAKYLLAEIYGGARHKKKSEVALNRVAMAGFWVPGSGVKLDPYGNVPGSTIRRILSDVQADGQVGYLANRTKRSTRRNARYKSERYFIPPPNSKLHPGVWVRRGGNRGKIEPALLFISSPHYEKRFDFFGRGMTFAEARFPEELALALRQGWGVPR